MLDDGLDYLIRLVGETIIEDFIYFREPTTIDIGDDSNVDIDNTLHSSNISTRFRDTDMETNSLSSEPPLPYNDDDYENDSLSVSESPLTFQYLDSDEGKI